MLLSEAESNWGSYKVKEEAGFDPCFISLQWLVSEYEISHLIWLEKNIQTYSRFYQFLLAENQWLHSERRLLRNLKTYWTDCNLMFWANYTLIQHKQAFLFSSSAFKNSSNKHELSDDRTGY